MWKICGAYDLGLQVSATVLGIYGIHRASSMVELVASAMTLLLGFKHSQDSRKISAETGS